MPPCTTVQVPGATVTSGTVNQTGTADISGGGMLATAAYNVNADGSGHPTGSAVVSFSAPNSVCLGTGFQASGGFGGSFHAYISDSPAPVTISSNPAGLTITADGTNYTAPHTFQWALGSPHSITVPLAPQSGTGGTTYMFSSWSDGGAAIHTVELGSYQGATYTANFSKLPFSETGGNKVTNPDPTQREFIYAGNRMVAIESSTWGPGPVTLTVCCGSVGPQEFLQTDTFTVAVTSPYPKTPFSFCWNNGLGCAANYATTDATGNWSGSARFNNALLAYWVETVIFANGALASASFSITQPPGQTAPGNWARLAISGTSFVAGSSTQGAYTLQLTGTEASKGFLLCGIWNGNNLGCSYMSGFTQTDVNGNATLTGFIPAGLQGLWQEWVQFYDGTTTPTIDFTVN